MPGTHVHTTVAKIYRRSHAGYACNYDCTDIYDDDEDDEEGAKMSFKIAINLICISLVSKYIYLR